MADSLVICSVGYDDPAASQLIGALQAYYHTLYHGPDRSPVDPREFTPPRGRFFVGYRDELPVAMGGWRWVDRLPGLVASRPAEIKRMYVVPASRGRGYGRAVLSHLEATAGEAGADVMVLSTGPVQPDAIALYRSAGYDDVPGFGFYARYDTAVHLGKVLRGQSSRVSELPPGGTGR
jgi:GNAT superfamily N-acetyltransferase